MALPPHRWMLADRGSIHQSGILWLTVSVCFFHKALWEKKNFLSVKQKETPLCLSFRSDLCVRKRPCLQWLSSVWAQTKSRCLYYKSTDGHFSHPAVARISIMNYFLLCDQILNKMVYCIKGSAQHVISLLCIIHLNTDEQPSCNVDLK